MYRKTILMLLTLAVVSALAIPPRKISMPVSQPDGTTITLHLEGNHISSFYVTEDGMTVLRGKDGGFYYARMGTDGLEATAQLAHDAGQRSAEERSFAALNALNHVEAFRYVESKRAALPSLKTLDANGDGLGVYRRTATGTVKSVGSITIPVIMVEFSDLKFQDTITIEKVQRQLTEEGYHDEPQTAGSTRDYFKTMSMGRFDPDFRVVAKVTLDESYATYGAHVGSSNDADPVGMVEAAIKKAAAQGVDFYQYIESRTSGAVPLVSIMYAGYAESGNIFSEEAYENYIWPHFSTGINYTYTKFEVANSKGNKTRFSSYFVGNELKENLKVVRGSYVRDGSSIEGINTFVHEFGHALGLPDFYCTNYGHSAVTMGMRDIMDYGSYYRDGRTPPPYSVYERSFMGWLPKLVELDGEGEHRLYSIESGRTDSIAFILRNPRNNKEYYLLENRQNSAYSNSDEMGHGLYVIHVDYSYTLWAQNSLNNTRDHLRMTFVPADGKLQSQPSTNFYGVQNWSDFLGDLYPGTSGNSELTDESSPATSVFTGAGLGQPIYDIREEDGVVIFNFMKPGENTSIGSVSVQPGSGAAEIYTIDGRRLSAMPQTGSGRRNIYIIRKGGQTKKILL